MRKRYLIGTIATVALSMALLPGVAQAAPKATIKVGNNFLSPSSKTVGTGTKVRFKWVGGETHKIVKRAGPGGDISSQAKRSKGVHLAKTLTQTGTYRFVCVFHPEEMRLKLVVVR